MKLSYYCSSCKKENYINSKSTNRHDLLMELGISEIKERCKHCGNHTKKHINRLYAENNKIMIVGSLILAGIITVLLWDFGYVSTLSGTIPIAVWVDQKKKSSNFNRTMVK